MAQTHPACWNGGCGRCSQLLSCARCSSGYSLTSISAAVEAAPGYGVTAAPLLRLFLSGEAATTAATTLAAALRLPGVPARAAGMVAPGD